MNIDFPQVIRRKAPEVLAPAGKLDTLKTAIDFGADAVYLGGREFGMRANAKNFTLDDIDAGLAYARARGARVFVTVNVLPTSDEVDSLNNYMATLNEIGVDALIVSDIGVLMSARKVAPDTEIHISTQAGITNYQAANAFVELGASRVVLARELDLAAIRQIRANVPQHVEIEAFVHGAMCMAFSGRCLISQHTTGRDANHGDCAQSCRWKYHVVEEKRPGQFFPVEVTDEGTFLFNSQDMNTLEHVDEIIDAGVTSLKIEGRAKSAFYVATVANAYKTAVNEYMIQRGFEDANGTQLKPFIDPVTAQRENLADVGAIQPRENLADVGVTQPRENLADVGATQPRVVLPEWLKQEPYKVAHREYSTGFYYPENPASEHIQSGGSINEWRWVGVATGYDSEAGRVYLLAKNKIAPGAHVEFLFPNHEPVVLIAPADGILDDEGNPVAEINHNSRIFSIPCPEPIPAGAMVRVKMR
ncbi:MAG: U32 family peptidase [Actinomycetaceae bacterium]|nr:U32 family peptidase [Actinomycetaceae bacterium]